MATFYKTTGLTGGGAWSGGTGNLDAIDGANLAAGDIALTYVAGRVRQYLLKDSAGAVEDSPWVIIPDSNPGNLWWDLHNVGEEGIKYLYADYAGDLSAALTAIGATETVLVLDVDNTVSADLTSPTTVVLKGMIGATTTLADGVTLTVNGLLDLSNGGYFDGTAGGGTETLVVSKLIPTESQWVGDNLTVSINGTIYSSNFNDADLGARINRAITSVTDGNTVIVTGDEWFDTTYSTGIDVSGTTVLLQMPGVGDGTSSTKAHYTGTGAAIKISRSRSIISGGFGIDFVGNLNTDVDGINVACSNSVINDYIDIASPPRYGIDYSDPTSVVYNNAFTGAIRISSPGEEGVKYRDAGSGSANFNSINKLVISGSSTVFTSQELTSLTQAAGTATATKASHGYEVGYVVTVSGADQDEYNGAWIVKSVPTDNTFTFTVDATAVSPATGTIDVIRNNVGVNFINGYANVISHYYDQNGAAGAWSIATKESNPNTIVASFIDSAVDNSVLGDSGIISIFGGKNNSPVSVREVNGGHVSLTNNGFEQPSLLNPRIFRPQNIQGAAINSANPSLYGSLNSGGSFPFNHSGHFIIETGNGADDEFVIINGLTGEWVAKINNGGVFRIRTTGVGNGVAIVEYAGDPNSAVALPAGSFCLNNTTDVGTYPYYIKRTVISSSIGWEGQGTIYS